MNDSLANLAIPGTPRRLFTYRWPESLKTKPSPGQRCLVPFGRRKIIGYYISRADIAPSREIKTIIDLLEPEPPFNPELLKFLTWMADYYMTNIADVLNSALPPKIRRPGKPVYFPGPQFEAAIDSGNSIPLKKLLGKKGFISQRQFISLEKKNPDLTAGLLESGILRPAHDRSVGKVALSPAGLPENTVRRIRPEIENTPPGTEQVAAIESVRSHLDRFAPYMLYGITGSGKTLVYCHVAAEVLRRGRTVLVMVPEIALAGTLLAYFQSFFKDQIALMHSALKPGERLSIWEGIKNGQYKIVVGARSAVFAPLPDLGLIIVDEEHDESYKQDDPAPRFQGRDAAVMRAKMADLPVILGSASPSLESFHNALSGRYQLLKLTRRPETIELPTVRLIDLKEEIPSADNPFFTKTLMDKVTETIAKKEQVILYLNRRGFSPRIKCTDCGFTPLCPHCQLHLTYHRVGSKLMCHFCGYIQGDYHTCAACGGTSFLYIGTGTQKIEDRISEMLGDIRMVRLDSDSAAGRDRAHVILSEFAAEKYDLLLGTQMVTKGIDFPKVSLVGVLMADIGIDMPDFRASEKLFAKLIQVSGRSGRGLIPGEVVIQTFNPETDLIDDAARQDYDTFFEREIKSRKELEYPPFTHLVNFRFSGKMEDSVQKQAATFRTRLAAGIDKAALKVDILGPAPSPLYRLRGLYRRHLFVKCTQITRFIKFLSKWEEVEPNFGLPSKVKLIIDIDPYDMM